jgi:hypothetical protein
MKLRIFLLGIFILINSNLLFSQIFPFGNGISNFSKSGNVNNTSQQESNTKKRSYKSSNFEKTINDSIVKSRTQSNFNIIDTSLISLRKKIFGYYIFNNKVGFF